MADEQRVYLQKKSKQSYPANLTSAIIALTFDKVPPVLAGSSSIFNLRYFGDYDLITPIKRKKYTASETYDKLMRAYRRALALDFIILDEVKFQTKDGQKFRQIIKKEEFEDIYKDIDIVKFDFILYADDIYYELSSIYAFSFDETDTVQTLRDEIPELRKEGKYFKMLKRFYSLATILGQDRTVRILTEFFNKHGEDYRLMSNLETLEKTYSLDKSRKTLHRIYENLRILHIKGIEDLDFANEIEKIYKKLQKIAKKFYDDNNDLFTPLL